MNILFLTIGRFDSIEAHSIYSDLLRCFRNYGHEIYTITPYEKRTGKKTELVHEEGAHVLHLETGNVTGANNLVRKGLEQLSLEAAYIKAIKHYYSYVKFDLVMYSTPPITFSKAVEFVKKRDGAKSYLLLKDIFPQNAVDLGMMTKTGAKGLIYKYFRRKEKRLYNISDHIGCMSKANVKYVIDHNPHVDPMKVEVCPNSIEVMDKSLSLEARNAIRKKYDIPLDRKVFVYGGNLGKPQGIPFLIECLQNSKCEDVYFLIIGDGSEFNTIKKYIDEENPRNVRLIASLPKEDYDSMVGACDVGLIFLDYRFTIPNFPSRILAYMQAKLPVLAVTDPNTDIGDVIKNGKFGWWCESDRAENVCDLIKTISESELHDLGENAYSYLKKVFSVNQSYEIIMRRIS